jgi:sirohydrochlorin cobaltochelatase
VSRALIFAHFGTADKAVKERCLAPIVEDFRFEFPQTEVLTAYTSACLQKKVAEQGDLVPSLDEALAMLAAKHVEHVYVQPGHIAAGEDYRQKLQPMLDAHAQEFTTLELGEPLLSRPADNQQLLYALLMDLHVPAGTQLVLVGHGSPDTHNPAYEALQAHIDKEGLPIHVGVFAEGEQPDFAAVLQRLQTQPDKNVLLAPLLLANGYHARRDILGDAPESWQSRLTAAGYAVTASDHGLGEYPGVRQLFVRKARRLLGE